MYEVIDAKGNVEKSFATKKEADEYVWELLRNGKSKPGCSHSISSSINFETEDYHYNNGYTVRAVPHNYA